MEYATPIGQEALGESAVFVDGNPEAGIEGSAVPAKAFEPGMRELLHLIRFAGLTPSGTDLEQVRKAIAMLIESASPGLATLSRPGLVMPDGTTISVDATGRISTRPTMYTCTTAAATETKELDVSGFALTAGATLHVVFAAVNAAANPTLNVSGTGAKPITCYGIPIEVGALAQGQVYTMIYSGSAWQIIGGMSPYPIGQYVWWEDTLVRPGFKPANANIISDFAATYPQMAAYLSTAHGSSRCFASLAEYEAAHNAAWATLADGSNVSWNNIGGVAKFFWNKAADTLLMPDLTEMTRFMSGASLGVGDADGDRGRLLYGEFTVASVASTSKGPTGVISAVKQSSSTRSGTAGSLWGDHIIDSTYTTPVGPAFVPRRWGALACAYLGQPAS